MSMAWKPKVVILCGGLGTRLREETELRPKPLVEVGGKPILWHILKLYAARGFNDFVLCLGYKGEMIRDYFQENNPEKFNITFVDTGEKTNSGGRIKRAQKFVDGDYFLATYGDGVSDLDMNDTIKFHLAHGKVATLTGVHPWSKYGKVVTDKTGIITQFVEKPILEDRINGGFFVFSRKFFEYLGDNDVLEAEPFAKLVKAKQIMLYAYDGFWHCLDTYKDKLDLEKMWQDGPKWKVWKN
jgi:glucose-1-phosphate cytidylyltransferase